MHPAPNRLGLGMRQPMPSFGQGPSMVVPVFVGSISGGISDGFLNDLLSACGPTQPLKRLITPAGKPQGFGFCDFQDPDGALRALELLNGVELPALEDGCVNKKLLVKVDEKNKTFLDAYQAQKMKTDADEQLLQACRAKVQTLVTDINKTSLEAAQRGLLDKEKYVIPPHLHDLQEADLPETQRGLVMTEIAQFRERSAKREREKMRDLKQGMPVLGAPSGPKMREWGKPQNQIQGSPQPGKAVGKGPQSYDKPVGFVKAGESPVQDERNLAGKTNKSDEELEAERREARRRDEEASFRDRERRYEPRERVRIQTLERTLARERAVKEAENRDRIEMRSRLDIWDDDESDELFYTDRPRWRAMRARRVAAEESADNESRVFEDREAENLRQESELFLARQMDEMQALQDEQRKAGMLLDDGAPVRLNVSLAPVPNAKTEVSTKEKTLVFGAEEEEEEGVRKRKAPLVRLDLAEGGEKAKERLEKIAASVPTEKEALFKGKVRWDGLSDGMIDRKLEPLIKRLMTKHLGELDDDDLVMFVVEHLKDHKGPQKLVEGLEPVLEEEAVEFTIGLWRQVIFESMAYGEGLHTEKMMVE